MAEVKVVLTWIWEAMMHDGARPTVKFAATCLLGGGLSWWDSMEASQATECSVRVMGLSATMLGQAILFVFIRYINDKFIW